MMQKYMIQKLIFAGICSANILCTQAADYEKCLPPQRVSAANDGFLFWNFKLDKNQQVTHFASNEQGGESTISDGCYRVNNYYDPATDKWTGFGYANYTGTEYRGPEDIMLCCNPYFQGQTYGVVCLDESLGPINISKDVSNERLPHTFTAFSNTAWVKKCILEGDGINGPFERGDKCGVRIYAYVDNLYPDLDDSDKGMWLDEPIELVLADFTDEDESKWYVVENWETCDIVFKMPQSTVAYEPTKYRLEFFSTKTSDGKITTPPYFCLGCFKTDYFLIDTRAFPWAFGTPQVTKVASENEEINYSDLSPLNSANGEITYEIINKEYADNAVFGTENMIVKYELEDGKYLRPINFTLRAIQDGYPYDTECEIALPVSSHGYIAEDAYEGEEIPYLKLLPLNQADGPIFYEVSLSDDANFAGLCDFNEDYMIVHFEDDITGQPANINFDLIAYQNGKIYKSGCYLKWIDKADWDDSLRVETVNGNSILGYSVYTTDGIRVYEGTEKPMLSHGLYIVVRRTPNGSVSSLEAF